MTASPSALRERVLNCQQCGKPLPRLRPYRIKRAKFCSRPCKDAADSRIYTKSEYDSMRHAFLRCTNSKRVDFPYYGGRGIKFLFSSFREAAEWMVQNVGHKPPNHSLDRIDTDGHYEPGNLRWATVVTQRRNRRTPTVLNPEKVRDIRRRHAGGERPEDLAKLYSVNPTTIAKVIQRRIWADV